MTVGYGFNTPSTIEPNHIFEDAARETGARVTVRWTMPGPHETDVLWMVCYTVNDSTAIVQTYRDGRWGVFTHSDFDSEQAIVDEALARCLP